MNFFRSVLHNIGVTIVSFAVAFVGAWLDSLFGIPRFDSFPAMIAGWLLLGIGFVLRVWATDSFYKHHMRVISLEPQSTLVTSGPFRISRNPLYLGGNVFMFLGTSLILGSPIALVFTLLHLPLVDLFIRREEAQLEQRFGQEWLEYKKHVRRWI